MITKLLVKFYSYHKLTVFKMLQTHITFFHASTYYIFKMTILNFYTNVISCFTNYKIQYGTEVFSDFL